MVDACPNVEVLQGEGSMIVAGDNGEGPYAEMLVNAAAKLPMVKEFSGIAAAGLIPCFLSGECRSSPALCQVRC